MLEDEEEVEEEADAAEISNLIAIAVVFNIVDSSSGRIDFFLIASSNVKITSFLKLFLTC